MEVLCLAIGIAVAATLQIHHCHSLVNIRGRRPLVTSVPTGYPVETDLCQSPGAGSFEAMAAGEGNATDG